MAGGREDAVQGDGFVMAFMEHSASIWKKWAMSSRSERFSSGAECYAL